MNFTIRHFPVAVLLVACFHARGSTTGFVTPDFRGQAGTEYGLWDNPNNFSIPLSASLTAPGNVANPGGTTDAVIRQMAGAPGEVFITGGNGAGNLYSFSIASQFVLSDVSAVPLDQVWLQVRANGSELDYESVKLSYDLGSGPQFVSATRTETDRTSLDGNGFAVSSKWEFHLNGLNVQEYTILFNASGPSLSLDSVSLDTSIVPEPSAYALALAGGVTCLAVWRRRFVADK
ncbi:MAG TPA: hypothetical protein PLX89_17250 [Verrucomicrobiota bacterium]|nr:hypothetical protein [Verrucomicrobiota bacterium]